MAAVAVKLLVLPAVLVITVLAQQRDLQQRSVDR